MEWWNLLDNRLARRLVYTESTEALISKRCLDHTNRCPIIMQLTCLCRWAYFFSSAAQHTTLFTCIFVERPALAVRLDLSFRSVYFFNREYLPNRWTYLNKSLHGDGNWLGIEYGGFEFLRLGAKNVTFCPDLPGVTFTKSNMAPKWRTISKIENCPVLAG